MKKSNLPIIERSRNWLIVNKPVGISVHNEKDDVRELLKKQLTPRSYQDIYPVHRLDKETSGLLVVATEPETAAILAEQFQNRLTEKRYVAVLRGSMPIQNEWQTWSTPISDKAEGRKNPQGLLKDRVEAVTQYRVLKSNKYFSLVEFNLLTGRQHQIRKHSALAKHGIVGDNRYGDRAYNEKMAQIYGHDRMFLHAHEITLSIGGKNRTFTASIPEAFSRIIEN